MNKNRVAFVPIEAHEPASVRAVILARSSEHGAKADDMRSQIEQCVSFIRSMGWTLVFPAYTFTEAVTGMRNVNRPVLDEVLKLAVTGQVDTIVCREMERVARTKGRRWQAIQTALDHGVEFRFANISPDGKMPDDPAMRLYWEFREFMAEAEAEKIHERLWPEKQRRYQDGLPHGGRSGPLYGYAPGERRIGKHGKPMGLLTWVVDEQKAQWVRWLYDRVDSMDVADLSQRGLTAALVRHDVPTASGQGHWCVRQVNGILRNPKYAGLGRSLRYYSVHTPEQDKDTHVVREVTHRYDRMAHPEEWERDTYPIPADVIPPIISPEQWHRVQAKLDAAAALNNRGGPRRTDAEAVSTLLDGGFIRCAECGSKMTRYWMTKSRHPYYQCFKQAGMPAHPHPRHQINARKTDALVLKLLAKALTDPEQILALADAAEQRLGEMNVEVALATSAVAAAKKWLTEIANQQEELRTALSSLGKVPGMENQLASIRARLVLLDQEREQALTEGADALPQREHAVARAEVLRQLFRQRNGWVDFATEATGEVALAEAGVEIGTEMHLSQAAQLLGMTEEELRATKIPIRDYWLEETPDDPTSKKLVEDVRTEHVVWLLLRHAPRERVRKLLRDLQAVVTVKLGRTRAEYLEHGTRPIPERVDLQLLGVVQVRTDVSNLLSNSETEMRIR